MTAQPEARTPAEIIADPPILHRKAGDPIWLGLSTDLLQLLDAEVNASSVTLETGAGVSTLLFASKGCRHICVCPDADLIARITDYCLANGVSTGAVQFVVEPSEKALPALPLPPLDVVLIDGRHGFPAPQIDWFYTAAALRVGGLVVVDDIELWSCRVLRDFLAAEPEWDFVAENTDRWSAFRKLSDTGVQTKDWDEQVLELGIMRDLERYHGMLRGVRMLRKGQLRALVRGMARRVPRG